MVPWKLSWPFVEFCNDALAEHLHAGEFFRMFVCDKIGMHRAGSNSKRAGERQRKTVSIVDGAGPKPLP